ncbi:hypothetical protein [Pyramidobacter piscolens]|uniref:hypothetical protein n=1 Tax=Pyramidobacter piscolens TaxID=638849 RepID=UPI00266CEB9B|nr:hypothetical protein [Pyramidobacter piscolens]
MRMTLHLKDGTTDAGWYYSDFNRHWIEKVIMYKRHRATVADIPDEEYLEYTLGMNKYTRIFKKNYTMDEVESFELDKD